VTSSQLLIIPAGYVISPASALQIINAVQQLEYMIYLNSRVTPIIDDFFKAISKNFFEILQENLQIGLPSKCYSESIM
jgi:flagellar motor switch protein FliG